VLGDDFEKLKVSLTKSIMYLNKVFLYGNLTRDPELKALPTGGQVAEFGLATNRVYKDRDGNKKEEAEFHNIVSFGRQAEVIAQYLKKGRPAFIEGRIRTRSWEAKDGSGKRYRTEIVLEGFQFGPGGQGTAARTNADEGTQINADNPRTSASANPRTSASPEGIQYPEEEIKAEDIPF
jgi:single-strand DNA-binding protein